MLPFFRAPSFLPPFPPQKNESFAVATSGLVRRRAKNTRGGWPERTVPPCEPDQSLCAPSTRVPFVKEEDTQAPVSLLSAVLLCVLPRSSLPFFSSSCHVSRSLVLPPSHHSD